MKIRFSTGEMFSSVSTEAWDPGSNQKMMREIVEKVAHVQGKLCALMAELIEETGFVDDWRGWEKSCTPQNFPGFPGLGTRERGEDLVSLPPCPLLSTSMRAFPIYQELYHPLLLASEACSTN